MPTIKVRTALGANATVDNALAGSQYEYVPWPCLLEAGIVSDATGVLASFVSGSDLLMDESTLSVKTINVSPVYPDDFDVSDECAAGDRIRIKLRDTSGVARVVMTTVKLTPR